MLVHRFKVCFWVMVGLGHPSLLLHILCIPFLLVRISICRRSHDLERLNQVKSQISQCCCLHISSPSPPSTSRPIAPHRASSRLIAIAQGVDVEELRADNDELRRQNAELEAKAPERRFEWFEDGNEAFRRNARYATLLYVIIRYLFYTMGINREIV